MTKKLGGRKPSSSYNPKKSLEELEPYSKKLTSPYSSKEFLGFRRKGANYDQLYRNLVALHHEADAEDLRETVQELNALQFHRATRDAQRRDFLARSVYVTLDKAIKAYKGKEINERQFADILYGARDRLSRALQQRSPQELRKKKPRELSLTEILRKETMKEAAAILAFVLGVLSFDQVRVTGMAVSEATGGYDYYSLFGFLFFALAIFLLLMKKH